MAGAHNAAVVIAGWPLVASVLYGTFGVATAAGVVAAVMWRKRRAHPALLVGGVKASDGGGSSTPV